MNRAKKILVIPRSGFVPAFSGSAKRIVVLIEYISKRFDEFHVVLIGADTDKSIIETKKYLHDLGGTAHVIPNYTNSKPSIIRRFKEYSAKLFWMLFMWRTIPFTHALYTNQALKNDIAGIIKKHNIDIAMPLHSGLSGYVAPSLDVLWVLDSTDTAKGFRMSCQNYHPIVQRLINGLREVKPVFISEVEAIRDIHKVIAINPNDAIAYEASGVPKHKLVMIETCVNDFAVTPAVLSTGTNSDILLVASRFSHTEQGCDWLWKHVFPLIHSKISITVVGNICDYVKQLPQYDHITVNLMGRVPDVTEYYSNAKIVVVPIKSGSGTSVKTQEAFCQGACVVTTTIGARVSFAKSSINCLIADQPASFAQAITQLVTDTKLRTTLGLQAYADAQKLLSKEYTHKLLDSVFDDLPIRK